jgi:hypothetical protein
MDPPPPTYTPSARLRLALSDEAAGLSDSAAVLVTTAPDGYATPGDLVAAAHAIAGRARHLLLLAVIAERARGIPWQLIGQHVGATKQAAHGRWANTERQINDRIVIAWLLGDDPDYPGLPHAASAPVDAAHRLDAWSAGHPAITRELSHLPPGDPALHYPVSVYLAEAALSDQLAMVNTAGRILSHPTAATTGDAARLQLGLARRKCALYQAMLSQPANSQTHPSRAELRELIAKEQAWLTELESGQPTPQPRPSTAPEGTTTGVIHLRTTPVPRRPVQQGGPGRPRPQRRTVSRHPGRARRRPLADPDHTPRPP